MIIAYLLSALSYISGIGLNVTSGWLITMASFMPPVLTLSVAVVLVRFFGISRSISRYLERLVSHQSVFGKLAKLRSTLFRRITSNPSQLIIAGRSGRLIKQVVDDVERVQEYELRVILPGVAALISMFAATALAFWLQVSLGILWFVLTLVLILILPRLAISLMNELAAEIELAENRYSDQVRDTVHGALEAEIYGYLNEIEELVHEIESRIEKLEVRLLRVIRRFQLTINMLIGAAIVLTIVHLSNVTVPAVQVAMLTFLALTGFEATLAWYPNLFSSGKLLIAKKNLDSIPEMSDSKKIVAEFDQLTAKSYAAYWDSPTITPQSFNLRRGDVLVLRGASGAGKTTTAMGIFDLVRYSGSLKIGGIEVNQIANLSELASGALQNGYIFNTSLRENLRISGVDDFDEVLRLLELDKLVSEMPDGLDTVIGEFGRGISGGEAKRIILARALLSNAPLLVLDEPTEHLDPELAERITKRILENYKDRALLVITHSGWGGVPQLNLERKTHEN